MAGSSVQAAKDPLADLEAVDWSSLHTAGGSAADIPTHLRGIVLPDKENQRRPAYEALYGALFWQSSPRGNFKLAYDATPHVVRFLLRLLEDHRTPNRENVVEAIIYLTIGYHAAFGLTGFNAREYRTEVEACWRNADLEARARSFVAQSELPPGLSEPARESIVQQVLVQLQEDRDRMCNWLEAYDTVYRAIPRLLQLLHDPDYAVRNATAFLLGFYPEAGFGEDGTVAALFQLIQRETNPIVRWTAIVAAGLLQAWLPPVAGPEKTNARLPLPNPPYITRVDYDRFRSQVHTLRTIAGSRDVPPSDRFAADFALAHMDQTTPELVARLTQALLGPILIATQDQELVAIHELDFAPLFCHGDVRAMVAHFFCRLKGEDYPDVLEIIFDKLTSLNAKTDDQFSLYDISLVTAAIHMTFHDEANLRPLPPFERLTELQKKLILKFANLEESVYHLHGFNHLISLANLPQTRVDCRRHAGLM